ncbi:MAG: hypothetical protein HYS24_07835 [Ignavibacteriales bacterium]|nr:hypothetical protein [Ignavibacteriales bacterium]
MRTKIIIILIMLVFEMNCLNAQNDEWKTYTNSSEVRDIAEESNFLWLATNGGLVKFDKLTGETEFYNRSNSGLPSIDLRSIAVDGHGNKWIGAYNSGLVKFDGITWTIFNTDNSDIPFNYVGPIEVDKNNNLWFASYEAWGIVKYDGYTWVKYDTSYQEEEHMNISNVEGIAIDSTGYVWVSMLGGGIAMFDGVKWKVYGWTVDRGNVIDIIVDKNNIKWATSLSGLIKIEGENVSIYNSSNSNIPFNSLRKIAIDKQGSIWITSYLNEGIIKYNGTEWSKFKKEELFHSNLIIDDSCNCWLGSAWEKSSFYKFDGNFWTPYNITNNCLPTNSVVDIYCDNKGKKWFGTIEGLVVIENGNWMIFKNTDIFKELNPGSIYVSYNNILKDNNDNLLVTTDKGLCNYDGKEWTIYNTENSALPSNSLTSIAFDYLSNKWITTWGGGLVKFDGVNWRVYNTENSGIRSNFLNKVAIDDKNNIWIGTVENGLSMFDGENWLNYNTTNSKLTSNNVRELLIDKKGSLWISSGQDLIKYDGENWEIFNFDSIEDESEIICLTSDRFNNIWFGTLGNWRESSGLFKFDGKTSKVYNTSNSKIASDQIISIEFDNDGILWIGTWEGLCTFNENFSNINKNVNYSLTLPNCDSSHTPLIIEEGNFSEGQTMKFPEYNIPNQYSAFQPYYNSLINAELFFPKGSLNENIKIEFMLNGMCENGLIDSPETEEIVEVLYLSFNVIGDTSGSHNPLEYYYFNENKEGYLKIPISNIDSLMKYSHFSQKMD